LAPRPDEPLPVAGRLRQDHQVGGLERGGHLVQRQLRGSGRVVDYPGPPPPARSRCGSRSDGPHTGPARQGPPAPLIHKIREGDGFIQSIYQASVAKGGGTEEAALPQPSPLAPPLRYGRLRRPRVAMGMRRGGPTGPLPAASRRERFTVRLTGGRLPIKVPLLKQRERFCSTIDSRNSLEAGDGPY